MDRCKMRNILETNISSPSRPVRLTPEVNPMCTGVS